MSPSQPHKSYDHRTRAEKLGVKPGQAVLLVGITDAHFISELQAGGARITRSGSPDVVFCGVDRVTHSWVGGRRTVEDGHLVTVDEQLIVEKHNRLASALFD